MTRLRTVFSSDIPENMMERAPDPPLESEPRVVAEREPLHQPTSPLMREPVLRVVGVGGVGSWTVEALARSGVGEITLIDLDDVCITNVNRQLPALDGQIGRPKVDVLA